MSKSLLHLLINVSLLNKSIHFLKKNIDPKHYCKSGFGNHMKMRKLKVGWILPLINFDLTVSLFPACLTSWKVYFVRKEQDFIIHSVKMFSIFLKNIKYNLLVALNQILESIENHKNY